MLSRIATTAICLLTGSAALADDISAIRCSFRSEGFQGGKSNAVSCAMSPQDVYSTNKVRKPADEMCDQKSNQFQENYIKFVADLKQKTVSYQVSNEVSDFAKPTYIQYLMRDGKTKAEATAQADKKTTRDVFREITAESRLSRQIFFGVSGQMYSPPKELATYVISFDESTLYYTDSIPEAVIVEATGDDRHTWVNMKFGMCESQ